MGVAKVKVWYELDMVKGVRVGDDIYVLPTSNPYTNNKKGGNQ